MTLGSKQDPVLKKKDRVFRQKTEIGVLGLPINKKGQFLLTLRNAPESKYFHKKWQIPGGGIEFGETVIKTLEREIKEELGVKAEIIFPHPIVKTIVYKKSKYTELKNDLHLILLCYLINIGNQKISFINDLEKEALKFKWFYAKEINETECLPMTKKFIQEAEKLVKTHK